MANEVNTGLPDETMAADALAAMAVRVFDPGELLAGPAHPAPRAAVVVPAEDLPYVAGPTAEVVRTFDPAAYLGDAARRGPAMIGNGKPLVARIGGVEVVTIPLEHYAALVSPLALAGEPAETDPVPDAGGMLELLLTIYAGAPLAATDLVRVTGLTDEEVATLVVARKAALEAAAREAAPLDVVPTPEATTIDLPSGISAVDLTPGEIAATYDAAVQRGDTPGGAMDRHGRPSEPAGKGVAAIDAERGSAKRSRR